MTQPTPIPELEICIETLAAGAAAKAGGADRVELCVALELGGLTPSHALLAAAVEQIGLPVHVLLRPRAGGFVYSNQELLLIERDLEHARSLGASGVVVGLLDRAGEVDFKRLRELVLAAGPMQVSFHRAFDHSRDLDESLERVIEAGCGRVLTSGGRPKVGDALETLAKLVERAAGRIRIAAGGGVTFDSARALLERTQIDLHASLRRRGKAQVAVDPLWTPEAASAVDPADVRAVAELLRGSATVRMQTA